MGTFDHDSGEHLTVDGARIYYEVCGNKDGPPLLFLHGGVSMPRCSKMIKSSRLLNIPFAGHVAFGDQKDIFLTSLRQFLALA